MIDTTRNIKYYIPPSLSLLDKVDVCEDVELEKKLTAKKIHDTLLSFGVKAVITDISQGPVYTRYELTLGRGVSVSSIVNLLDDIQYQIAAKEISIEAPIPGKSTIGIDVLNKKRTLLRLREILVTREFLDTGGELPFAVGKDIGGRNIVYDLVRTPHLLMGGATGTGKSVFIHSIILSLLYRNSPNKVRLLLIDPQGVELSLYRGIPYLIIPVITDVRKASAALNWAVAEMQKRYMIFVAAGARDLNGYNSIAKFRRNEDGEPEREPIPRIVIIVNELADLMMADKSEVESAICRLAQLARAVGIHLIIATQRPSMDVITGLIKNNMLSRVAFAVSRQVDSRIILDMTGAEKLMGKGDMLFFPETIINRSVSRAPMSLLMK